jgi:hypothetical protein
VVCEPLNLFTVDAIDILAYNFKGFLVAGVPEAFMGLFNNVVNIVIESNLAKR